MVEKINLRPVLRKIEEYLPASFLSPSSPLYLEKQGIINSKEKKEIEIIKNFKSSISSYQKLEEKWHDKDAKSPEKTHEGLAFLIDQFEKMNSVEGKEFKLYDEEIVALVRAIDGYKDPKIKGKILEMAMSEGKSSVVMPILVAYLALESSYLQVQTVNPYLVERDFSEFKKFAEFLGINDYIGKVGRREKDRKNYLAYPSDDPKDPHNRIVFGLWSDFVHSSQFAFREESLFYPAEPVVVLDEIDQVVQDESVTPAIITEKIKTGEFFDQLIKGYNQYSDFEWLTRFGEEDFNLEGFKIGRREFNLSSPEDFINTVKSFYQVIKEREEYLIENNRDLSKTKLKERISDDLSELAFLGVIRDVLKKQPGQDPSDDLIQKLNNKFYDRKGDLKTTLPFFWWDLPDFQQALMQAYFLKKGVDYTVKEEAGVLTWVPGRFPVFKPGKLDIKPLTKTTGYSAGGKEFQDLVQLMLYVKENLTLPQEISFGTTDTIPVGEFYQIVPEKIIGLTGSASPISERLRHGYGLETTVIPSHNQSQREISWQTTSSPQEKENRTIDLLITSPQQNSLVVVESDQEAIVLANRLKKEATGFEIQTLTPQNENEDKKLYSWISVKGENKKVLITAKMVGRGVDLQPDEEIKKSGFLLISLTPFEYERTFRQLAGRVGRRGEKGSIFVLISPEDVVFDILTSGERKKLKTAFNSKNQQIIEKIVELAWQKNEEEATEAAKHQHMFYQPFSSIRSELKEKRFKNPKVAEKIKREWNRFLEEAKIVYDGLTIAGQGGPLVAGAEERIWSSFVWGGINDYQKELETNPSSEKIKQPLIDFLRKKIEERRKIV